jgi:hypothetical protein
LDRFQSAANGCHLEIDLHFPWFPPVTWLQNSTKKPEALYQNQSRTVSLWCEATAINSGLCDSIQKRLPPNAQSSRRLRSICEALRSKCCRPVDLRSATRSAKEQILNCDLELFLCETLKNEKQRFVEAWQLCT